MELPSAYRLPECLQKHEDGGGGGSGEEGEALELLRDYYKEIAMLSHCFSTSGEAHPLS